eukprot:9164767-Alexandrium_andersonii.AAC.1
MEGLAALEALGSMLWARASDSECSLSCPPFLSALHGWDKDLSLNGLSPGAGRVVVLRSRMASSIRLKIS